MASIHLRNVTKRFGSVTAVDHLDLELQEGELLAILGPSGCGKTTTLRMIAGFEVPDGGTIYFGDDEVTATAPEHRNTGMVFQNYALFPHLTVYENVAFGLEMRRVADDEVKRRVKSILETVQLSGLEGRYPRQLSGGQQQRTALARALVTNPASLLLDEPLANLDANLREEMRFFVRSLQQEFGITTLYVTHDQAEALVLADRIAVMRLGVLQQLDAPEEVYRRPRTAWVAQFIGLTNLIPGHVNDHAGDTVTIATSSGMLTCRGPDVLHVGDEAFVCVRPETLKVTGHPDGAATSSTTGEGNQLIGVVRERAYLGNFIDYRVAVADDLVLRVQAPPSPSYSVNDRVALTFETAEVWSVPREEREDYDGR